MKKDLPLSRLTELLHYDAETGRATWRVTRPGRRSVDGAAGAVDARSGYRIICIDGTKYRLCRVAWLYVTGEWPKGVIDHINGNKADDRFANLRDVSYGENSQNRIGANRNRKDDLPLGVYRVGKRFEARIRIAGSNSYLGTFPSVEMAHAAYMDMRRLFLPGNTI